MPWMTVVILLTLLDTLSSEVACIRLADIYWNATNPIFRIDNTDHIIDVNQGNVPFEYDQVNIICPVYPRKATTHTEDDDDAERYIIYNVSKEEYDSCRITTEQPRIIAVCDKPHQLMYFTITFRSFTPQPGGLEFLPGNDYYFVSTSTGSLDGLNQRVGGRCASHHMKVIFKVCCSPVKGPAPGTSSWTPLPGSNATSVVSGRATEVPQEMDAASSTAPFPEKPFQRHPLRPSTRAPPAPPSGTPRWVRPHSTPLKPYEVPIEDEMAKAPTNDIGPEEREQYPSKARAKNEELVNDSWRTSMTVHRVTLVAMVLLLLTHMQR